MKDKSKFIMGVVSAMFVVVILYSMTATGRAEMPFATDKTDRTLIKEIWQGQKEVQQNQKEIIKLLQNIKNSMAKLNK